MRNLLAALLLGALIPVAANAQGFGGMFPGPGTVHAAGGGGGYSGPGDLKSYNIWVGTYAYSAATRGAAVVNVCNGGVCGDLSTHATTGLLVTSTNINGAPCDDSGHVCTIKTWYNQGASGATYDFTQATAGSRATLLVSCTGLTGAACGTATGAVYETTSNYAQAAPYSLAWVGNRNAGTGANVTAIGDGASAVVAGGGFFGANNDAYCNAGSNLNPSVTDAVWHGFACNINGASSNLTVDVTNSSGNAGSSSMSGHAFIWDYGGGGRNWQGKLASMGIIPANSSTADLAAANAASKTILGY